MGRKHTFAVVDDCSEPEVGSKLNFTGGFFLFSSLSFSLFCVDEESLTMNDSRICGGLLGRRRWLDPRGMLTRRMLFTLVADEPCVELVLVESYLSLMLTGGGFGVWALCFLRSGL